jgi:hypothetical protein
MKMRWADYEGNSISLSRELSSTETRKRLAAARKQLFTALPAEKAMPNLPQDFEYFITLRFR